MTVAAAGVAIAVYALLIVWTTVLLVVFVMAVYFHFVEPRLDQRRKAHDAVEEFRDTSRIIRGTDFRHGH
jgi:heme/copper-type cytochrome/quinol oxidase subunit 2